jgi:hypothetical protein
LRRLRYVAMFKDQPTWLRVTLGVLGSLVVGAIGSGIWERAGDPLYVYCRDAILNLATLGLSSLKDSLYTDVAIGLHERSSSDLFGMAWAAYSYFMLILTVATFVTAKFIESRMTERPPAQSRPPARDTIRLVKRVTLYGLLPAIFVMTAISLFTAAKTSYTAKAIGNYNQLINLVGPFVTSNEVLVFNSRFAQVTSAQDYVALNSELRAIAQSHKLRLPKFEPW